MIESPPRFIRSSYSVHQGSIPCIYVHGGIPRHVIPPGTTQYVRLHGTSQGHWFRVSRMKWHLQLQSSGTRGRLTGYTDGRLAGRGGCLLELLTRARVCMQGDVL
ncbi:hypothetical protein BDV26DRAFT_272409 [Aspergillus bertholletiae]|uniref:Uncharacterized protein n=1 Tax=Aspergillus bertholletiae TaxID=1226010 RepID=A0A5N7ATR6_9EURO|nr:hypothetical protein BDV26DRAFT_272409 [Aspergillus bertholletiae]